MCCGVCINQKHERDDIPPSAARCKWFVLGVCARKGCGERAIGAHIYICLRCRSRKSAHSLVGCKSKIKKRSACGARCFPAFERRPFARRRLIRSHSTVKGLKREISNTFSYTLSFARSLTRMHKARKPHHGSCGNFAFAAAADTAPEFNIEKPFCLSRTPHSEFINIWLLILIFCGAS